LLELASVSADSLALIDLLINQMPGLVSGFFFGAQFQNDSPACCLNVD